MDVDASAKGAYRALGCCRVGGLAADQGAGDADPAGPGGWYSTS